MNTAEHTATDSYNAVIERVLHAALRDAGVSQERLATFITPIANGAIVTVVMPKLGTVRHA